MNRDVVLRLLGSTRLGPALGAAAARLGVPLTPEPDAGREPVLVSRAGGGERRTGVVPDGRLAAALTERALASILAAWPRIPGRVDATVLVPAAGVCGPAGAGPVNAVRDEGVWTGTVAGAAVSARLLRAQQNRCWLISAVLPGVRAAAASFGEGVEILPGAVAGDTARAAEFMQDRGLGGDWPQVLLFGEPAQLSGDAVALLAAFTEAGYARALIASALGEARR